ncbi:polyhydroxyalkanoate synthesis regulator DNA-binding domain-containing protein [Streptomyces olivoreticuli]
MTGPNLAPARIRLLCRQEDGTLYDTAEQRRLTLDDLVWEVRAGGRFRAYDRATGTDCTFHVLSEALAHAALRLPGLLTQKWAHPTTPGSPPR